MRYLVMAAFCAAFLLFTSPAVACPVDRFGANGWICNQDGALDGRVYKKKLVVSANRAVSRHSHVRKRRYAKKHHHHTSVPKGSQRVLAALSGETRATRIAGRYLGTNPTRFKRLWCADFMNKVERMAGRRGTRSRAARSFLRYGRKVSTPLPGDIAIFARGRRGGHVAYIVAIKPRKIKIRGGNQCGRRGKRRVCDSWVSRLRAIGYRRV